MALDRKDFLKLTGLGSLGAAVGACPFLASLARASKEVEIVPPGGGTTTTGTRWAMTVDIAKCAAQGGCQACADACHRVHNVPDWGNKKDEVKWIWKEPFEHVLPDQAHGRLLEEVRDQDVPTLCNHCDSPPCVRVCPTKATFRREDGIVAMDPHRCIGCRFCVAACPYGSRSFNWKDPRLALDAIDPNYPTRMIGVVEKCNFCVERLAEGKQPACVEACEHGALSFGNLNEPDSTVARQLRERFSLQRRPGLGTSPMVYYLIANPENGADA